MSKFIRYLMYRPKWHKLPSMPRSFAAEYVASEIDRDTAIIMSLTRTRCPGGVESLQRKYGAQTRGELARILRTLKPRRNIGARFMATIRRVFGLMPYDPLASYASHRRRE